MRIISKSDTLERWGIFEIALAGFSDGNPFTDYDIKGIFTGDHEGKTVDGFYDGDGVYRVRFMPSFTGEYHYTITGSFADGKCEGRFLVTPPSEGNHGPVHVANTYHFAYADGTPYYPIGTTCYVWELQDLATQEQTLKTLADSAFNKIRFCIFPKHYDYNLNEPYSYPYMGTPCPSDHLTSDNFSAYYGNAPGNDWDFTRFNPAHFAHIESRIADLMRLGIEADLIVMHPYDRWGFSQMTPEQDDLYWRYVIARFSAYRNVWWSLANEYDLMPAKSLEDWERYAGILCEKDPYHRLRSIHNCRHIYDFTRPWVTHCCIQRVNRYLSGESVAEWRERFGKPVVLDEIIYEGNIQHDWGNISGQELVRRFWEATVRGGYAGHGETYLSHDNRLWWSHGGILRGTSPERFKFLRRILAETPGCGLRPCTGLTPDGVAATVEGPMPVPYYLIYYGINRPSFKEFDLKDGRAYQVQVIDTWEMTIEDRGIHQGRFRVDLPGKEYMAIRLNAADM